MTESNLLSPISEISFIKEGIMRLERNDSLDSSLGEDDQQHEQSFNHDFSSQEMDDDCKVIPIHTEILNTKDNSLLSGPNKHSRNQTSYETSNYEEEFITKLQKELKMKTLIVENQIVEISTLQQNMVELQVKIASLGGKIIQLENSYESVEREKNTLQKLLATSREMAKHKDRSINKSFDRSLMDKSLDIEIHESTEVDASIDSSTFHASLVIDSLRKELEITKGRESRLRTQLEFIVKEQDGPDKIMETISESQQEAISYLSSEVEELRSLLMKEGEKIATHMAHSSMNNDTIHVLEEENQAVAAQVLEQEKMMERLQQDLSTKLGENACLRDEIAELEQKLHASHPAVDRLKNSHGIPSPDRSKGEKGIDALTKRIFTRRDSETELSLMTVEMEGGDQGDVALMESYHNDDSINQSKVNKKFDILKRAMKQKYESKIQKLEETISTQQSDIKKLKKTLSMIEKELVKSQECAEDLEIRRVFMEAEMNQEAEGMRVALKDRSLQVERLKKALLRLQSDRENNLSNSNLKVMSDYLIEGVGASVEYIESFISSFDAEDMKLKTGTHPNNMMP